MRFFRAFSIIAALVGPACAQVEPPDPAGTAPDAGVADSGVLGSDAAIADAGGGDDAATPAGDAGETRAIEPAWESLGASTEGGPGARWGTPFVYAPAMRKLYLFGGSRYPAETVAGDTWSYSIDDHQWTELDAANAPPARYCIGATLLPEQNQILLVGGRDDRGPLPAGAWTLDLATEEWTAIDGPYSPGVIGPSVEWMPSFPGGGRAIIFGGSARNGLAQGTWTYDPVARKLEALTTTTTPPARQDGAMVFDPGDSIEEGRLLLFSGSTQLFPEPEYIDELWAFDGVDWRKLDVELPRGRRSMGSVFDPVHREWIIFSGTIEDSDLLDLWLFDARTASFSSLPIEGAAPPRGFAAFGYAKDAEEIYLHGGLEQPAFTARDDVWSLRLRARR